MTDHDFIERFEQKFGERLDALDLAIQSAAEATAALSERTHTAHARQLEFEAASTDVTGMLSELICRLGSRVGELERRLGSADES